ncbi:MAG: hypothetical protein M1830_010015 [Pleopsidium flavum]|nr:MAG: hypothetical protein M1830_010015 [Pleopsidium flavum]
MAAKGAIDAGFVVFQANFATACKGLIEPVTFISAVVIIFLLHRLLVVRRQLYLHPLSKFPGPPLAAISNFNYSRSYLGGRQPYDMLKLHEKYGPVVRVAPEELSFSSPESWRDIYGQRSGHQTFVKSNFYSGGNFASQAFSIVSERDPAKHREMKKYLSTAFSDRSLKNQEYLISGVIDQFIQQIGKLGGDGIDMTTWFNLMTFDVIGELAFGESFGGVASGKLHFWISVVLSSMGQASVSDTLTRFPRLGKLYMKLNPSWLGGLMEGSAKHESYTLELVDR